MIAINNTIGYIKTLLLRVYPLTVTRFFEDFTVSKKLLVLLAPLTTLLISMRIALLGLTILIIIDLLTGIRKSHHMSGISFKFFKKEFWLAIKSFLLRDTWRKSYEYGTGIIVIAIFEALIFGHVDIEIRGNMFSLAGMAVVIPAAIEIWSIFENLEAVSGSNILKRVSFALPDWARKILEGKNKIKDK